MNLRNCIPTESLDFLSEITRTHLSLDMVYAFYGVTVVIATLLFCVGVAVFGRGDASAAPAQVPTTGERVTPVAP